MEISSKQYQIRIKGQVPERYTTWFEPLTMVHLADGNTLLQGQILDQSQLVGIINQIHSLNLKLISIFDIHAHFIP